MEDNEKWYVYSWNYNNPSVLYHEMAYSKEEALLMVNEIMDRGDDWDAYASTEKPERIEHDIW